MQSLLDSRSLKFIVSLTLHDRTTKSLLHLHKKKKPPSISAQFQVKSQIPAVYLLYTYTPSISSRDHSANLTLCFPSDFSDQAPGDSEQSRAFLYPLYPLQCWEGKTLACYLFFTCLLKSWHFLRAWGHLEREILCLQWCNIILHTSLQIHFSAI